MSRLRDLLREGRDRLADQSAAALEAEVLMAHLLSVSRSHLFAHPERPVQSEVITAYRGLLERRQQGEPIAYITGTREFWSLALRVTPEVLIPRAETESLVERALQIIPAGEPWRLADLGTGSGAIALALASERPLCEIHATDCSAAALDVARANAKRLRLQRVRFHLGDWCDPLSGRFRLIASNPPYLGQEDPHLRRGDCRFEPRQALVSRRDPLACIRAVADQALRRLAAGGWLLLEHGPDQATAMRALLGNLGYGDIETHSDLLGHERLCVARRRAAIDHDEI